METSEIARMIRDRLAPLRPRHVILFGSAARGQIDRHSDVDVIVVLETDLPFIERAGLVMRPLRRALGRSVDALVYTPEEFEEMKARDVGVVARAIEEGIVVV